MNVANKVITSDFTVPPTLPLVAPPAFDCTARSAELVAHSWARADGDGSARIVSSALPRHVTGDMVTALYLQSGEVYAVVTRTSIVGYNIEEGEIPSVA